MTNRPPSEIPFARFRNETRKEPPLAATLLGNKTPESFCQSAEKINACVLRLAHGRNLCPNSSGRSRRICRSLNHEHVPSRDYERIRGHILCCRNIRTVHPFRYGDAPCRAHTHTHGHSPSNRNSDTSNPMPPLQSQLQPQQQSKLDSSFSYSLHLIFPYVNCSHLFPAFVRIRRASLKEIEKTSANSCISATVRMRFGSR